MLLLDNESICFYVVLCLARKHTGKVMTAAKTIIKKKDTHKDPVIKSKSQVEDVKDAVVSEGTKEAKEESCPVSGSEKIEKSSSLAGKNFFSIILKFLTEDKENNSVPTGEKKER